ncbi:hypothetical protein D3C72_1736250 [compost metagenome]
MGQVFGAGKRAARVEIFGGADREYRVFRQLARMQAGILAASEPHPDVRVGRHDVQVWDRQHDLQLHIGVGRREAGKVRDQHLAGEGGRGHDAQRFQLGLAALVQRGVRQQVQRGAHLFQVFAPGGAQRGAAAAANEEGDVQQRLQRGDALADGAGGDEEFFAGALE